MTPPPKTGADHPPFPGVERMNEQAEKFDAWGIVEVMGM